MIRKETSPHVDFKTLGFDRYCKTICMAGGDLMQAEAIAQGRYRDSPHVIECLKSAVAEMGTSNTESLAQIRALAAPFLEKVNARTVIGKLMAQMRVVPPQTSILAVQNAPTFSWVRESHPMPVGYFSLDRLELHTRKLGGIAVFTKELAFSSDPAADSLFGAEMARAMVNFTDQQFLSPDAAPVAEVSPGSITYGSTVTVNSTGTGAAAVVSDLNRLFAAYDDADGALDTAVLVLHPRSARHLAGLQGANGGLLFPRVGARGGEVWGVPALVSSACSLIGSPSETYAVLLDPQQLLLADDGGVEVSSTTNATLQMNDAPASGATSLVDLWGSNLRALKVERTITWDRQSANSAAVLRGCAW